MEPQSLSVSCITLIGTVTKVSASVTTFLRDVQDARRDLDLVVRELSSLQAVLRLLADDTREPSRSLPVVLQKQILGIMANCTTTIEDLEHSFQKHAISKPGKPGGWIVKDGKSDIVKLRSNLEAHKSALEIALEIVTITIARDIKEDTGQIRNSVAAVKHDTAQILEEIARLQAKLPDEGAKQNTSSMLQRYLHELSSYAESIYDPPASGRPTSGETIRFSRFEGENVDAIPSIPEDSVFAHSGSYAQTPDSSYFQQRLVPKGSNHWKDSAFYPKSATDHHRPQMPDKGTGSMASPSRNNRAGAESSQTYHNPSSMSSSYNYEGTSESSGVVAQFANPNMADTNEERVWKSRNPRGPLSLLLPIPKPIWNQVSPLVSPSQKEFTYVRYTAISCDTRGILREKYALRPELHVPRRVIEMFIIIDIEKASSREVAATLRSIVQSLDFAAAKESDHTWRGKEAWGRIVVCFECNDGMHLECGELLSRIGIFWSWKRDPEEQDVELPDHERRLTRFDLFEYTSPFTRFRAPDAFLGDLPLQMMLCLPNQPLGSWENINRSFGTILRAPPCIFIEAGRKIEMEAIYSHHRDALAGLVKDWHGGMPVKRYRRRSLLKSIFSSFAVR